MLAGVGPAPAVLFVVAADEGWRPQSDEHLAAVDALGARPRAARRHPQRPRRPGAPATAEAREQLAPTQPRRRRGGRGVRARPGRACRAARALDRLVGAAARAGRRRRRCGSGSTGRSPSGAAAPWSPARSAAGTLARRRRAASSAAGRSGSAACRASARPHDAGRARWPGSRSTCAASARRRSAAATPCSPRARGATTAAAGRARSVGDAARPAAPSWSLHVGSAAVPVRVRPLGADARPAHAAPRRCPLRTGDRVLLRDPGRAGRRRRRRWCSTPTRRRCAGGAPRRAARPTLRGRRPAGPTCVDRGTPSRRRPADRPAPRSACRPAPTVRGGPWRRDWLVAPAHAWQAGRPRSPTAVDAHAPTHPLEPPACRSRPPGGRRRCPTAAGRGARPRRRARASPAGRLRRPGAAPRLGPAEAAVARAGAAGCARHPFARAGGDRARALAPRAARAGRRRAGRTAAAAGRRRRAAARRRRRWRCGCWPRLPQPFTLSEARQALGTTRRVAVPLLEHLDRRGWTRAAGRVLREVRAIGSRSPDLGGLPCRRKSVPSSRWRRASRSAVADDRRARPRARRGVVRGAGLRGLPHRPALPRGRHQRRLPVPARATRRPAWSRRSATGVTDVAPGDFVVLNWRAVCGECRACLRGPALVLLRHPQRHAEDDARRTAPPLSPGARASAPSPRRRWWRAGQCTKVDPRRRPGGRGPARLRRHGRARRRDEHRRRPARATRSPCSAAAASATPRSPAPGWPARARSSPSTSTTGSSSGRTEFGATHTVNAGDDRPGRGDPRAHRRLRRRRRASRRSAAPRRTKQAFYARDLAGTVVLVGVPTPTCSSRCR